MKIYVDRKWKKTGYTIGRLYVNGVMLCNTLEPQDFGLRNDAKAGAVGSEEYVRAQREALMMKAQKGKGKVAIPAGHYEVVMVMSQKFGARRLCLKDVPGFSGILIHEGNTKKDTQGCILVGTNSQRGMVTESRKALGNLNSMVLKAMEQGEKVVVQVAG